MPAAKAPFLRFQESYKIDQNTGCWIWMGHSAPNHYGLLKVFGKMVLAHRFSYELFNGPIPIGLEILHSCDNRKCVNPAHIRVGTHAENMAEAASRERMPRGTKHPAFGKPNPRRGANSTQSKCVIVLGRPYGSIKEAERALDLGSGTVRFWLKTGSPKASEISREEYYAITQEKAA